MIESSAKPDLAAIASLIGEPSRAAILEALMSGESLPAGDLSTRACVSPQTTSSHLNKLVQGGLVKVEPIGKRRYFKIASVAVAQAIEALCLIAPPKKIRSLKASFEADALRQSRTCYDHLAGKLGVAVTEFLINEKYLKLNPDKFIVTPTGAEWFASFGVDVDAARQLRRKFAYPCLDWSERRPHLAGSLGAALTSAWFDKGWVARMQDTRAIRLTKEGQCGLKEVFKVNELK